jgi:hypothetical protein
MSFVDWYLYKANQCTRLASEAANDRTRTSLTEEAALCREIARDLVERERREAPP